MSRSLLFFIVAVLACTGFVLVSQRGRTVESEVGDALVPEPADEAGVYLPAQGESLYSQFKEELIIRDFFEDRTGGLFVDIGAAHYKELSTTYYLEKHNGWSGIGVDALEEYAADYVEHRPKTRFFHYAITDRTGDTISFFRSTALREMSSVHKDVAQRHGELWYQDDRVTEVTVKTITLDDLLEASGIERFDFLSMDIEDSEPAALAGFDIQRFRPSLVCIEAHAPVQDAIHEYFLTNNYRRLERYRKYDELNWYYTPGEGLE